MLKTEKLFGYAKQLIRKNSVYCCSKNKVTFSQSERTDMLDPSHLHGEHIFLNDPFEKPYPGSF